MKTTTKQTIRLFISQMGKEKLLMSLVIFGISIAVSMDIISVFFYKDFFDILSSDLEKNIIVPKLTKIILSILTINAVAWIFWRIGEFSANRFWPKIMGNIRNDSFKYLHQHSYGFFNNNFVGALVKKVSKLVNAFEGLANKLFWDLLPLAIRVVGIIAILFTINTTIGMVMLGWVAIFTIFNYLFANYKLKYDIERSEADTRITATLADTITNNINLKLFTSQSLEEEKFGKENLDWGRKAKKTWDLGSILDGSQAFLTISLEFVIFYLGIKLWQNGTITLGYFVMFQGFLLQIIYNIWNLGRVIREVYERFSDAEEMIVILNTPHEIKDLPNARKLEVTEGKIEFKNVSFGYNKKNHVIKNFDLTINPGEKVALIGPSGGGKSTIVKLLFRFFDINEGQILIDNQDVKTVTQKSLRKNLSLVPQDPILFHRSLIKNIRYGKQHATDREIIEAAKLANCHEFISKFPENYQTYVGERGVKLSGGERQRIAIARAILKNAPVLVLDEATSSLDSHSEMLIQQALDRLMKDKTTIVIAHRLSTIMKMDRIIVIKEGKIEEIGTHKELTTKDGSLYKMLWEIQAGQFIRE